jgi:hypothetical protein
MTILFSVGRMLMTQTIRSVVCVSLLALGGAIDAVAQTTPAQTGAEPAPLRTGFVNINGAFQGREHVIEDTRTFTYGTLFPETGTFRTRREVDRGALFDISGGVRVWRELYAGLGVTRFSDSGGMAINASVPDPLAFGRPRSASTTVSSLRHAETGVHVQFTWMVPVTTAIDVAVSAGPSFFSVRHDMVGDLNVSEGAGNTPTLSASDIRRETESGAGFNIGLDGTYLLTQRLGAGLFLRYAGGTVDFAQPNGGRVKLDTGGFQMGGGLRVRF